MVVLCRSPGGICVLTLVICENSAQTGYQPCHARFVMMILGDHALTVVATQVISRATRGL